MPMTYTDHIQAATVRGKIGALIGAVVEIMTDGDEALDRRDPEPLEHQDGFAVSMCAALSFYSSTGTGTPVLDSLIAKAEDAQAAEWASQYPGRPHLYDVDQRAPFWDEAESFMDAALEDEDVWARVEIIRDGGDVIFASCFTDEVNAPQGVEYRERMAESAFLDLDGPELESLAQRVASGPYLTPVALQNSGGLWTAWLGTSDGKTAYFSTSGHASEAVARSHGKRAPNPWLTMPGRKIPRSHRMTVSDLIDYLSQFPGETRVYLNAEDTPSDMPGDADYSDESYIALDILAYDA